MKLIINLILSIYLPHLFFAYNTFDVSSLKISSKTDQIMIVIPSKNSLNLATFYYYIKKGNIWNEFMISEAHIGKNGIGKEREGDYKTPIGLYQFNSYFGIADNPGAKVPYIKLNNSLYWNGDSDSPKYNQMVNIEIYTNFDISKSEHLIDETSAYQYAMNINYNENGVPYLGSAIFLHCYTKSLYTAGCVAIPHSNMIKVVQNVNKNAMIIIDYEENIYQY